MSEEKKRERKELESILVRLIMGAMLVALFYATGMEIMTGYDILPQGYTLEEYQGWQQENEPNTGLVTWFSAVAMLYPVGNLIMLIMAVKNKTKAIRHKELIVGSWHVIEPEVIE